MDSVCMKRCGVLLLTALAGVAAFAVDSYYLSATEKSNTYSSLSEFGFANPARWGLGSPSGTPADAFDSTADYIVRKNSLRLVVKSGTDKTFQGGRLVFGTTGNYGALLLYTTSPNVTTFGNNGLLLVWGCILCTSVDNATYLTDGPIDVDTCSSGYTHISFNYNNNTLRHRGTLSVQSGKTLVVGGGNSEFGGNNKTRGTFDVFGCCAGIAGTVQVVSQPFVQSETLTDDYDTTFSLGTTAIPGTVDIGTNCRLRTLDGTNVLEIANLSFAANTWLDVPYDSENFSFGAVRVTGTFTVADKVTITAPATVPRMAKAAVLTVPRSSGVTEANFTLADSDNDPYRTLTVEEEGDDLVVYITYANIPVYQSFSSQTMGSTEYWSDGLPARAGVDYVLDVNHITNSASTVTIKMPTDGSDYFFPGDSLTLGNKCSLAWTSQSGSPVFGCRQLRMLDGSALDGGQKAYLTITGGVVTAVSGKVTLGVSNGRLLRINSEIAGGAELVLAGYSSASSSPYGWYWFNAANTNFTGRITVRQRLITNDANYTRNNYSVNFNRLYIADGRSLGGNLETATPNALTLSRYGQLRVESGNATLAAESNRGIFIEDLGRILVGSAKTFRLETSLALNGTFWKEGAGTLELAGSMAFGSDGVTSMPETDKNNFIVTGGVVRVCSADALNGAAVTFHAGSALELAVNLDDAELTQYGIRNVKTDMPFTLGEGVDTLPLTLNVAGVTPTAERFTVNYLTVTQTAIDNGLGAKLPTIANPFHGYRMTRVVSSDDVAGTVTYGLRFSNNGTCLLFR